MKAKTSKKKPKKSEAKRKSDIQKKGEQKQFASTVIGLNQEVLAEPQIVQAEEKLEVAPTISQVEEVQESLIIEEPKVESSSSQQCRGITQSGTRCRRKTNNENGFCKTHQNQA